MTDRTKPGGGCWGVLLLPVALIALVAVSCTPRSGDQSNGDGAALVACRRAVKDQLKNPSTAKFSDESFARSGSTTTVTGMVVAENSLGGKVTYSYSCDYSGTTARVRPLQERR